MKNRACSFLASGVLRLIAIISLLAIPAASNAAPVLQDLLSEPTAPTATSKVAPTIPVGKALVFPVSAYEDSGSPLTFTVKSSNPAIMARVRTGNPLLKLNISHAAGTDPAVDPAYNGTLVFQLFRDWTPMAAGFIGGFAQSGSLDNTKFQRLSDLNGGMGAAESLIYQGGGQTSLGFTFENELRAPLLFSGRGQLAMANAGTDSVTYTGTNGSQFFITHGNLPRSTAPEGSVIPLGGPRHLDFKHTVFGQLTHGWDVMDKFHNTPRTSDSPVVAVNIASAGVSPRYDDGTHIYTDAVLLLTANSSGTATITVSVTDGHSAPVTSTFTATAKPDTNNSAPFVIAPQNAVGPKEKIFSVPLVRAADLEYDYISTASGLVNGSGSHGQSQQQSGLVYVLGSPGFTGVLHLAFGITQFDMSYRGQVDGDATDFSQLVSANLGVGDELARLEPIGIYAQPGTAMTNVAIAKFLDDDSRGGAAGFTASINWGDGSALSTGVITADTSRPVFAGALVMGTHTFAKEGNYTITSTIFGDKGFIGSTRSAATVSAKALRALGQDIVFKGKNVSNVVLASISDAAPVAPKQYEVTIDWGDGTVGPGHIKADRTGKLLVFGNHTYLDAETFSLGIRVHKTGGDAAQDAQTWSAIKLNGFNGPLHLPPFSQAHLIGDINQVANLAVGNAAPTYKSFRSTTGTGANERTLFTCEMVIINSGNLPSKPGKLRFYLSADKKRTKLDPAENPADIPLKIGPITEFDIPAQAPGAGIRYVCDKLSSVDLRLKPLRAQDVSENGTGLNLIGVIRYSDPLADKEPIDIAAVAGPFNGINVRLIGPLNPNGGLQTTKAVGDAHTAKFSVSIDRQPAAGQKVVIKATVLHTRLLPPDNLVAAPAEGTLSSLEDPVTKLPTDPVTLTFDSTNWQSVKEVTVTGNAESVLTGNTPYIIQVSVDPLTTTDPRFKDLDPADVSVINLDTVVPTIILSKTSLTTTEALGAGHIGKFGVKISPAPLANQSVVVRVESQNTAEGTVDKALLTFNSNNFNISQEVTVTGVDDQVVDPDVTYNIHVSRDSTTVDPRFNNVAAVDLPVTNVDAAPKVIVTPTAISTSEAAGAVPATFTVKLSEKPGVGADVTITLTNGNPAQGTLDKTTLVFTSANATDAQTVSVTGLADPLHTGQQTYKITVNPSVCNQLRFNGLKGSDVTVTNLNDAQP